MGEWTYSCSLRLWPLYRGGKRPSVPTSQEAARGQKSIFKSGRKEKSLLPQQGFEIWFLRRPSRSLATIATSISRLVQEAARGQISIFKSGRKEKPLLPQQGFELWFLRRPSRSLATIATSIPRLPHKSSAQFQIKLSCAQCSSFSNAISGACDLTPCSYATLTGN